MAVRHIRTGPKALIFGLLASTAVCIPQAQHVQLLRPRSVDNTTFPYQNASLCIDDRLDDLIARMTVAEKAGQLFHTGISMGPNGTLDPGDERRNGTTAMIGEMFMSHYNLVSQGENVTQMAEWHNAIQDRALATRLGIPITLSTDPRHAFTENIGTGD